jgi:hypothetical protein
VAPRVKQICGALWKSGDFVAEEPCRRLNLAAPGVAAPIREAALAEAAASHYLCPYESGAPWRRR